MKIKTIEELTAPGDYIRALVPGGDLEDTDKKSGAR